MMKKAKNLILPLAAVMAVTAFTGCSPEINQGPEVSGASDITCLANTAVDLLSGVSALDKEDGDITPDLKITVTPEVAVQNGYAVFPEAGDYEVCYEVHDSEGKLARATVAATVQEREVFMDTMLTNGFALKTGGQVKVLNSGLKDSAFAFKTQGQEIAEDVQLTRTYTVNTNVEYTFTYTFTSSVAGKVKAAADGKAFGEYINVVKGNNEISFTYTKETEKDTADTVEIALWMGRLEGDLEVEFSNAEVKHINAPNITEQVEKLPDFSFTGKTEARIEEGVTGTVGTVEDGNGVYVDITRAASANYMGGVYVNTGLQLEAGVTYTISYNVTADNNGEFDVILQNGQFDAKELIVCGDSGNVELDYTVTEQTSGELWLYIASGAHVNKVTLKDLNVKVCKEELLPNVAFSSGNIINRDGNAQDMYASEDGKSATIVITSLADGSQDWQVGMFVNTDKDLVAGKTYEVSFDVNSKLGNPYDVCIQNQQWDSVDGWTLFNPANGHNKKTIEVTGATAGKLWLFVRSGAAVNTITISNLKVMMVKDTSEDLITEFNFDGKYEERFAIGPVGTAGATQSGDGAYVNITEACDENWKGGVFVNTGLNLEAAKNYTISYDVEADEEGFEVILQNGQYDANEFKKTYSTGHNEFNLTIDNNSSGELWLYIASGAHENEVTLKNLSVIENTIELVDKLPDFNFSGKIITRFDGTEGKIGVVDEGKGAYVEITKASNDTWRGGMFVETGFKLVPGIPYTATYDLEATTDGPVEVQLLYKQWGGDFLSITDMGKVKTSFTVTEEQKGDLWIYVAAGKALNKVTIKNFKLYADESGEIIENYKIGSVNATHGGDNKGDGSIKCDYGKIIYTVNSFGSSEPANDIVSPAFNISGAMGNCIITFRAKATQNVKLLFVPHVNDGWDPTLVWKEMKFTTDEQLFSIRCNDVGVEGEYVFLWRFGYGDNTVYKDVTIEISDIQICYLSDLER